MTLELAPRPVELDKKDHPPVADKVVMVDFDGTLYPWGGMFSYPKPLPGAPQAMRLLKNLGYRIGIFTSRLSKTWHESEGWDHEEAVAAHTKYIEEILARDEIPYDFITAEKVPAEAYFDDKAFKVTYSAPLRDVVFLFGLLNQPEKMKDKSITQPFLREAFHIHE